jgi:hypothetical protein
MIEARQMENAMKHENPDFLRLGMAQQPGIRAGDIGGDRDFAGEPGPMYETGSRLRRERENVGGLVLPAKTGVQRLHGRTTGNKNVDRAVEAGGLAGAQDETLERLSAQSSHSLVENNHVLILACVPDARLNAKRAATALLM